MLARSLKVHDSAQVSAHNMRVAPVLEVQIIGEGEWFDLAAHTGLFVSFASSSNGIRGIAIDGAFGKRPSPGTGAHQKKFNIAIGLTAITHGRDYRPLEGPPARELLPWRLLEPPIFGKINRNQSFVHCLPVLPGRSV